MKLKTRPRTLGEPPIGALALVPLFALPLGAWLIETGKIEFAQCGFKSAFGIPCLSCGSTRATINLLHGDVFAALALQPLALLVYAMLLVWGGISLWGFVARRSVKLDLTRTEDVAAKLGLVALPVINWAYLVWAGV